MSEIILYIKDADFEGRSGILRFRSLTELIDHLNTICHEWSEDVGADKVEWHLPAYFVGGKPENGLVISGNFEIHIDDECVWQCHLDIPHDYQGERRLAALGL